MSLAQLNPCFVLLWASLATHWDPAAPGISSLNRADTGPLPCEHGAEASQDCRSGQARVHHELGALASALQLALAGEENGAAMKPS